MEEQVGGGRVFYVLRGVAGFDGSPRLETLALEARRGDWRFEVVFWTIQ
jgi:hypothetical protein